MLHLLIGSSCFNSYKNNIISSSVILTHRCEPIAGAGIGGMNGLYNGLKETKAAQLAGAVRRTQYVLFVLLLMRDQFLLWLHSLTAGLIVKTYG